MTKKIDRSLFLERFKNRTELVGKTGISGLFQCQMARDTSKFRIPTISRCFLASKGSSNRSCPSQYGSYQFLSRQKNMAHYPRSNHASDQYRMQIHKTEGSQQNDSIKYSEGEKQQTRTDKAQSHEFVKLPKLEHRLSRSSVQDNAEPPYMKSSKSTDILNSAVRHFKRKMHRNKRRIDQNSPARQSSNANKFQWADECYMHFNKQEFVDLVNVRFEKLHPTNQPKNNK